MITPDNKPDSAEKFANEFGDKKSDSICEKSNKAV